MSYKIIIKDRNYQEWDLSSTSSSTSFSTSSSTSLGKDLDPISCRLFSNDVFDYDQASGKINIIHSSTRVMDNIPAVLILDNNKTYGRHPTNNKLLYKCVPNDIQLPPFLVPYELKQMGFSKVFVNLFVTIKFANWDTKHPIGMLTQVIGPVDCCENFNEYQLCCNNLNISLSKLNKATNKSMHDLAIHKETFVSDLSLSKTSESAIEDRTDWQVFTIDPAGSLDFDDAFSIKSLANGRTLLSVYIANVPLCLERLNLWPELTKRTSTIYLPDKKHPMLPILLSDCLCSLQANAARFAFTLDLEIENCDNTIVSTRFSNSIIKVFNNFAYEERALLRHPLYKMLSATVKQQVNTYPYIKHINDSHDVVCYLMILMNHLAAKEMVGFNTGIFRATTTNPTLTKHDTTNPVTDDVLQFIHIWRSTSGKYVAASKDVNTTHDILELDAYIHITSPIRRLVDVINMLKFQECAGLYKWSESALEFYDKWIKDIDTINSTMKAIRRVQNDCNLLHLCYTDPSVLDKEYQGYCFDEKELNADLYKYNVYLPELRIILVVMCRKLEQYSKQQYKLFVFHNEDKMKKKIRIHLV
jgi:exoribonuclease R